MSKILSFFRKIYPSRRKILQLYVALLYNCNVKGLISGRIYSNPEGTKGLCVPGLNCYSCPGAVGACPLGSLQNALDDGRSTLLYILGILALYGILFGRLVCGWLCPFGLIQELLHKIPTPKLRKSKFTRWLSMGKYVLLVLFVVVIPIAYILRNVPTPAFCKFICPAGTLEAGMLLLSNKVNASFFSLLGPLFTWKFLLMLSTLIGCVFLYRPFCRFLCPLGAIYGLFNRISFFGVEINEDKCIHCDKCIRHCQMDIRHVGDSECIFCGDCIEVCPTNAISWKKGKISVKPNEIHPKVRKWKKVVAAAAMIAILLGTTAYIWITTPTLSVQMAENGCKPGQRLPGANLPVITAGSMTSETLDPTALGKVTIINFWGTWCASCLEELPDFDRFARNYDVTVVAIHTDALLDTAPDYIRTHFPDSPMLFAADNENSDYYTALGGRGNYPHTVIIDENGIVLQVLIKPLSYAELEEIMAKS